MLLSLIQIQNQGGESRRIEENQGELEDVNRGESEDVNQGESEDVIRGESEDADRGESEDAMRRSWTRRRSKPPELTEDSFGDAIRLNSWEIFVGSPMEKSSSTNGIRIRMHRRYAFTLIQMKSKG